MKTNIFFLSMFYYIFLNRNYNVIIEFDFNIKYYEIEMFLSYLISDQNLL